MTSPLLPCPFCEGACAFGRIEEADHSDFGGEFVYCANTACGASSALIFPVMDDAKPLLAERWNRRAARAAPTQEPPAPSADALYAAAQEPADALMVFAQEVILGAYKPEELPDKARAAVMRHARERYAAKHGPWAQEPADEAPDSGEAVAWTLTETLNRRETTTRAHLWFTNPVNDSWTPLYTRPAVTLTDEDRKHE